ncbi:DUF1350 family protein [Capilliphycus salinus ALCB114379]|uniref:DUF1350 family protein n=1 Tax=Capilliphycus salinus TaxID=2768948 RepID=UPI0039A6D513
MSTQLRFEPIGFSWVAFHPQPKGIIRFIGGAFFGSFPTLSYRYFLETLFESGYTLVAIPFRFTFRHWSVSLSLLEEQNELQNLLVEKAKAAGYDGEFYLDNSNYFWVGHSLGCKYIALLELLSDKNGLTYLQDCISQEQLDKIRRRLDDKKTIFNQPSLLIAPDISDTDSAIPIKFLADFIDEIGLGVLPSRSQTECMIHRSKLFNITGLISFKSDDIAGNESNKQKGVYWFIQQLKDQNLIHQEIPGKHLEPVGVKIGKNIVDFNPWDKFIEPISKRQLEPVALTFLQQLSDRIKSALLQSTSQTQKKTISKVPVGVSTSKP